MDPSTRSLDSWTEAVTAGLPPSAALKFRAEIADHFAEARRSHIAAGMPAEEADRAALADLGDAAEVARTFHDAHFSRREYRRAAAAIVALFAMTGVTMLLLTITAAVDRVGEPNYVSGWATLWQIIATLGNAVFLVLVLRAGLSFLRERYDIHPPRWGWLVLAAGVVSANGSGMLSTLIGWIETYHSPFARLVEPLGWWDGIYSSIYLVSIVANVVCGALVAVFCISFVRRASKHGPLLVGLLGLGATTGLEFSMLSAWSLLPGVTPLGYYLGRVQSHLALVLPIPGYMLQMITDLALYVLLLTLLALLLAAFIRLRRPGAALTV